MTRDWTDEEIAAHVDGAMDDPDLAVRIARDLDTDPCLRRRVAEIEQANRLLREAFDAPMREPVPPAIAAALTADPERVAVLPTRRAPSWVSIALAASVALCVGFGGGWYLTGGRSDATSQIALGAYQAGDPVAKALESLPTGTSSEAGIRPILTFRDGDGRACREFETAAGGYTAGIVGIACRLPGGIWSVEVAAAATEPMQMRDGGFAPASAVANDVLSAALDALEAGPALAPDEEADLLESGWLLQGRPVSDPGAGNQ